MRFLLSSWGSAGDLHPFLAVGRGLMARGHTVSLVGHPDWGPDTLVAGIRFVSTGEPSRDNFMLEHPEVLSPKMGGLVSLGALVKHAIAPGLDLTLAALMAETPQHDAILAHHFTFPAPIAAELAGLPMVSVTLAPGVLPSAYSAPGPSYDRTGTGALSRARNRFSWWIGRKLTAAAVDPMVNRMRAKNGLAPIRDAVFSAHSSMLNAQLYSEHFAPRPPDWTAEKKMAGFCFFDPPGAALPREVEQFLAAGEPPILFTLGSVVVRNPGEFYRNAVVALEQLGLRGILLIGPEENRPANLPPSIIALPYAPYGVLMPRVRAVAHQCGIGTLSHTLRAGVPSIACPYAFDQPNNARRLQEHGMAEILLPHERSTAHIAAALQHLISSDATARARRMGELIRAEDGVAQACDLVEQAVRVPAE